MDRRRRAAPALRRGGHRPAGGAAARLPGVLLRHVRTRVKSPQTNGVIERFFGTLKHEHLYRGPINDGDALAVEVNRFRQIYNTIRPHQALHDRTPRDAYPAGR
jgi:putative transposase